MIRYMEMEIHVDVVLTYFRLEEKIVANFNDFSRLVALFKSLEAEGELHWSSWFQVLIVSVWFILEEDIASHTWNDSKDPQRQTKHIRSLLQTFQYIYAWLY